MYNELLEIALKYSGGDIEIAKQEVTAYMDTIIKSLPETEREFFIEKAGVFISDWYSTQEADMLALDMVLKKRPGRGVIHQQKQPQPRKTREGLEALKYMASLGIPLIGAYTSGAMIDKQEAENFTTNAAEISALMEGRGNKQGKGKGTFIQRFYFIPKTAGLFCLDFDRKPGKADGLKELYKLFPRGTLPRALQDIELFFPCYVKTPSGYHLYFKYSGETVRKTDLCPEVEIKHGRLGLTAPGSRKENGAYTLYGNIEDAPPHTEYCGLPIWEETVRSFAVRQPAL